MPSLSYEQRECLLALARRSIAHGLDAGVALEPELDEFPLPLHEVRASFVTLTSEGRLRGCIGALEARWPLLLDTARHAFAAAFHDPRFAPLARAELASLHVHVSVLSAPEPVTFASEIELIGQLRPGVDGLVVEAEGRRATFLPSVWESLPDAAEFLRALKHKAGIEPDRAPARALRYASESFAER